jgi:hypothetical protein
MSKTFEKKVMLKEEELEVLREHFPEGELFYSPSFLKAKKVLSVKN